MNSAVWKNSVKVVRITKCRKLRSAYAEYARSAITWRPPRHVTRSAGWSLPRPGRLLRELMHMGQFVQSHGMHFFHLAAPDLLFGFDADPATRNVFRIIKENPQLALKAVTMRRYGQQIIERLGGKRVHANFSVAGGVNAPLTEEDRKAIASELKAITAIAQEAIGIAKGWLEANEKLAAEFASFPSNYMGLVDEEGGLQLYDGEIRVRDAHGNFLGPVQAGTLPVVHRRARGAVVVPEASIPP